MSGSMTYAASTARMNGRRTSRAGPRDPLGPALGHGHDGVVNEDHRQAEGQTGQTTLLAGVEAERQTDPGEHQARHREREHLVHLHDLGMSRGALGTLPGDLVAQLTERHLLHPRDGLTGSEHGVGRDRHRGGRRSPVRGLRGPSPWVSARGAGPASDLPGFVGPRRPRSATLRRPRSRGSSRFAGGSRRWIRPCVHVHP